MRTIWMPSTAIVLAAVVTSLEGCSSSDSTAPPATGSLRITVSGPPGAPAAITVSGPAGYSRLITATTVVATLVPGTYAISATNVVIDNATYGAALSSTTVTVVASSTPATASVSYTLMSGTLALGVSGLPGGLLASVTVTGPGGFTQTATASQTFANVLPGLYIVTVNIVWQGSTAYSGLPPTQSIVVPASLTPQAANVTYHVAATGSLQLTIAGLPNGLMASVTVTGPGGFTQTAAASQTFSNVIAGPYTVTANTVLQGGTTYSGLPFTQSIVVPASPTPQAVNVTYNAVATASLQLTIAGLPNGVLGNVTVTGPAGFKQTATASQTFSNVLPGLYCVTPNIVVQGSTAYSALPSTQCIGMSASVAPQTVIVTYSGAATGSLQLTIAGLPGGVMANITVQGPAGTNLIATASETIGNLAAGFYLVTAYNVTQGSTTYAGELQVVQVQASQSNTAFVTYSIAPPYAGVWSHFMINAEDYGVFTVSSSGEFAITLGISGENYDNAFGSMSSSSFSGTLFLAQPGSVQPNVNFSGTCPTMNYCSAKVGLGRGAYWIVSASR